MAPTDADRTGYASAEDTARFQAPDLTLSLFLRRRLREEQVLALTVAKVNEGQPRIRLLTAAAEKLIHDSRVDSHAHSNANKESPLAERLAPALFLRSLQPILPRREFLAVLFGASRQLPALMQEFSAAIPDEKQDAVLRPTVCKMALDNCLEFLISGNLRAARDALRLVENDRTLSAEQAVRCKIMEYLYYSDSQVKRPDLAQDKLQTAESIALSYEASASSENRRASVKRLRDRLGVLKEDNVAAPWITVELEGDGKSGTIVRLENIHGTIKNRRHPAKVRDYAAVQWARAKTLLRVQAGDVFVEDASYTEAANMRRAFSWFTSDQSPAGIRKLFPKGLPDSPEKLSDDQSRALMSAGGEGVYLALTPGVRAHGTISELERSVIRPLIEQLRQRILAVDGSTLNEARRMRTLLSTLAYSYREERLFNELASFIEENPGRTAFLSYGMAHDFSAKRSATLFQSTSGKPRFVNCSWARQAVARESLASLAFTATRDPVRQKELAEIGQRFGEEVLRSALTDEVKLILLPKITRSSQYGSELEFKNTLDYLAYPDSKAPEEFKRRLDGLSERQEGPFSTKR